jgi:hypothetical protein
VADLRIERVVVTGGRKFTDPGRIATDLRALLPCGLRRVAEGQSPGGGADDFAHDAWLLLTGESTNRYPANISIDGPGRGRFPRRNIRMLEAERPDLVLAYPDPASRGTWNCVVEAVRRCMPVMVWMGEPPAALLSWERGPAASDRVAHQMRKAGLPPPMMSFREGDGRRIVVPPEHLDAGDLLALFERCAT